MSSPPPLPHMQDIGVVRLMRSVAPGLPVHGSTQMSITSAEGAEFARRLGCECAGLGHCPPTPQSHPSPPFLTQLLPTRQTPFPAIDPLI